MSKPSRQTRVQKQRAEDQLKQLGKKEEPLYGSVYRTNVPSLIPPLVDEPPMVQPDHERAQQIFTEGGGCFI